MFISIADGSIPTADQFDECWRKSQNALYAYFKNHNDGSNKIINMNDVWQDIVFVHNEMKAFEEAPHFDSREYVKRYDWLKEILSIVGVEWTNG